MSAYYEYCKRVGKCSRYGCKRAVQDVDGHKYTKCSTHRKRDAYRIRMWRSQQPSKAEYKKYLKSLRKKSKGENCKRCRIPYAHG